MHTHFLRDNWVAKSNGGIIGEVTLTKMSKPDHKGEVVSEITIDADVLKQLVAIQVAEEMVAKIEQASPDQILGLAPMVGSIS